MHFSVSTALIAALSLGSDVQGLKILLGNDDGFGSGNLREFYKLVKQAGHDVVVVAPAVQQSGQGGRSDFTTAANLTAPTQFNIVPAGAPSIGTDPNDSNIWYYNGTPAACTFVALDYVLPRFYPDWNQSPDLYVGGPNFGTNLGPFLYTLSGTIGGTYAAISRSIPGIALSASNAQVAYTNITNSSNPATWAAKASFAVVESFINATMDGQRVLPLGYGVNVNIPELDNDTMPEVFKTRLTGDADTDIAAYDNETGLFTYGNVQPKAAGVNTCVNGDCTLPGETWVVAGGGISVSVFTTDYDAPTTAYTAMVFAKINALARSSIGSGEQNVTSTRRRIRVATAAKRGSVLTGRDVRE